MQIAPIVDAQGMCRHPQAFDRVGSTSYDVITRADVDQELGKKSMHVICFVFLLRVVIINLYYCHLPTYLPFGQLVEIAWQKKCTDITDNVPVIWEHNFGIPSLQDRKAPCKRACNANTRFKHDYVVGTRFPCPTDVPTFNFLIFERGMST